MLDVRKPLAFSFTYPCFESLYLAFCITEWYIALVSRVNIAEETAHGIIIYSLLKQWIKNKLKDEQPTY